MPDDVPYDNIGVMKDGVGRSDIIGWPEHHFVGHKKRSAEFDAPTFRALLALRVAAQRVENALASWFLDVGLTPQKFGVLIVLLAEDAPISLSDLRRFLRTTQANVTGLIAGLERDGYVERSPSEDDRRVSFVRLSRTGRRIVTNKIPAYFGMNRTAMKALTQAEKKSLVDLLTKIAGGYAGEA